MTTPQKTFHYPPARRDDVVDDYHGTPVADPYRWLEESESDDTVQWGEAQSTFALDYLAELPLRDKLQVGLTRLWNIERHTPPNKRGDYYYYFRNDGLQNQDVMYRRKGLSGDAEQVIDPNTFSEDGTVALTNYNLSEDGSHLAYTTSSGGKDWQTVNILNIDTGTHYDEKLDWCRFTNMAWTPDMKGFYYSRFPETDDPENATSTLNSKVYYHKLGTPQSEDTLVYERPDKPELGFGVFTSEDDRFLLLHVWHAALNRNRLYYRRLDSDGDFIRLIDEPDAYYDVAGSVEDTLYIATDKDAERGRVIAIDLNQPEPDHWQTIIPESDEVIDQCHLYNGLLVVMTMQDAQHRIKLYMLDGTFLREIPLPGPGAIRNMSGKQKSSEMFLEYESYLYPPTVFRYDLDAHKFTPVFDTKGAFNPDDYETKQVFYPSKDGTQVSMFITQPKGITLDGTNPTLLYGYGGFSISLLPGFQPHILNWLEQGGVYVVANLRGGTEYGEAWHVGGMLGNKQNVFDDFIAAGEWLVDNGYTRKGKLAIMGRSNGGLLTAACMLQRPDLFGAIISGVPVTDMLRYHKFTAGRYWTAEYGNAEENAEHFKFLIQYSPVHNVKEGESYPPTLILSADGDDRVVPMHAKKFAAALQYANAGDTPIILRLDTRSGHGLGKPTSKWITEWADIQAFLLHHISV